MLGAAKAYRFGAISKMGAPSNFALHEKASTSIQEHARRGFHWRSGACSHEPKSIIRSMRSILVVPCILWSSEHAPWKLRNIFKQPLSHVYARSIKVCTEQPFLDVYARSNQAFAYMLGALKYARTNHSWTYMLGAFLNYARSNQSFTYMLGASKYARSNHYWTYMTYMLGVSKYARSNHFWTCMFGASKYARCNRCWPTRSEHKTMRGATIIGYLF